MFPLGLLNDESSSDRGGRVEGSDGAGCVGRVAGGDAEPGQERERVVEKRVSRP